MANASDAPISRPLVSPPFSLSLADFRPETIRGTPGFFRVGQTRPGLWWLIDPDDRAFFSRGVNGAGRGTQPECAAAMADSLPPLGAGDPADAAGGSLARLRAWQINTLGPGSAPELNGRGIAGTAQLDFVKAAPHTTIRFGGAWVPDVFDPKWIEACERRAAEECSWRRDDGTLIGYFSDDALNWAQFPAEGDALRVERPTLLQLCLSLEPSFPAYHAAWEFTLAAHGGELATLARAWDADLPNKEALRQLTLAETPLTSAGYRRDHERFSREFARRYFAAVAAAVRRHDPNHLILGCRFGACDAGAARAECVYPNVDVLSANIRGAALFDRIDAESRVEGMPVLIGEFSWADDAFTGPARPDETRGLTSVERMLGRGRAVLEKAFTHPALVGVAWARWADEPGDQPPFGQGLVHLDDSEAREHTELLADLNARAESIRFAALPAK